jgi:phosphate/sulfate permease
MPPQQKLKIVKEISITWVISAVIALAAAAGTLHLAMYKMQSDVIKNTTSIAGHAIKLEDNAVKISTINSELSNIRTIIELLRESRKEDKETLKQILSEVKQ